MCYVFVSTPASHLGPFLLFGRPVLFSLLFRFSVAAHHRQNAVVGRIAAEAATAAAAAAPTTPVAYTRHTRRAKKKECIINYISMPKRVKYLNG